MKSEIEKLSEDLLKCGHCGMCLPACPVYRETLVETDSPRARLALIKANKSGSLAETAGYIGKIYDCTSCMACSEACPSGVSPDALVSSARTQIKRKPLPLQKLISRYVLPYPKRLRNAFLPLLWYEKGGLRRLVRRTNIIDHVPDTISRLDSMLPELSGNPVYRGEKIVFEPDDSTSEHNVAYFPGCAQNLVFTRVARSTIQVLLKNSCKVTIPQGLVCCGMPHSGYGDAETARMLARKNIDAFEASGVDFIITDCATCGSTLKSYPSLLCEDSEYAEKAKSFSTRVRDISEFLMEDIQLNRDFEKIDVTATYHEPCHLGRGQKLKEAPRRLLQEILGSNFVEMNEADSCCGGAGSYTLTHRKLSMKILDRKMANLKNSSACILVTGCPGCLIQLAQGLRRSNQKIQLLHITELLAKAYGILPGQAAKNKLPRKSKAAVH